ncbi:MAG: YfcE family phosphodiesterase [Candidatus Heimdallarchaeota archaeon]|nr:YfcE family phosphodiesterase [Candidatus Heimdallarchaeota archaeon]MCK5297859.1 YfcE family phosphodiesterase [Candidatus Heimdallarchaeota archaeon]
MPVRIFVAGDLHIPSRGTMLHPKFQAILKSEKWDYIVLTGDLTIPKVLDCYIQHVKDPKNLVVCRGNMDQIYLPEKPVFEINKIRLGVFHGTGIYPRGDVVQLKQVAEEMNVNILFTGHSHLMTIHSDKEHLILNPGTSSGASGGSSWTVDTGIIILTIISKDEYEVDSYYLSSKGKLNHKKSKIKS